MLRPQMHLPPVTMLDVRSKYVTERFLVVILDHFLVRRTQLQGGREPFQQRLLQAGQRQHPALL